MVLDDDKYRVWTEEELEGLTKKELYKLVSFYGLKVRKRLTNAELIEILKPYALHKVPEDNIQRSVRVQRIMDLKAAGKPLP